MRPNRASNWTISFNPSLADRNRLRIAIAEETRYYNTLVQGFAAPIRTMGQALSEMTGRLEQLFSLIAAHGLDIRSYRPDTLPESLKKFSDILFDENGKLVVDPKKLLFFDLAVAPAHMLPTLRMAVATEVLRYARRQAEDLRNNLSDSQDQVYTHAMTLLVPLSQTEKRHCQIPRFAAKIEEFKEDNETFLNIQLPMMGESFRTVKPPFPWNHIMVREELDGKWVVELSQQSTNYLTGKTDFVARPDKKKKRK